jgi:predicted amidohydrolase
MTERDEHHFDVLYNTAVIVGPEEFRGKYRKVHQPLDEKHVFYPGDEFPVFDTQIGK